MSTSSVSAETDTLLTSLFRHESGRLVASLTRVFGPHNLQLAEDVVQEALETALQAWKFQVPENPRAWLSKVARNRALDVIRHRTVELRFAEDYHAQLSTEWSLSQTVEESLAEANASESQLRMMFTLCQPKLSQATQISLMLKFLCGFSTSEIAAAFLCPEETIDKRLQRGRAALKRLGALLPVTLSGPDDPRLAAVLNALYLLFNEGYHGSHPSMPMRIVLCEEALRLCALMNEQSENAYPQGHALMALMCFNLARAPGRLDETGVFLTLAEQDRSKWDPTLIERGLFHLGRSAQGQQLSTMHLEAGIACQHCLALSMAQTDWKAILALYELLYTLNSSPVIALNRALALSYTGDSVSALEAVEALEGLPTMAKYPFYWAGRAEIHSRAKHGAQAKCYFEKAASLARSPAETKAFMRNAQAQSI